MATGKFCFLAIAHRRGAKDAEKGFFSLAVERPAREKIYSGLSFRVNTLISPPSSVKGKNKVQ